MSLANITSTYRSKLIIESYRKWLKPGETVLDIGCGNGIVSQSLKKSLKIKVTGCDVINYLKQQIPYVQMQNETKLPFKNKNFRTAMLIDVLHHAERANQGKLLKEALRVSNRVLIFEVKPTFFGKLFDYIMNKIHNHNMNIPFAFRTVGEWENLFTDLKLKYKTKEVRKPFFYPFRHVAFYVRK